MPNISFFIPAYNCAETITEAVVSIMETNFVEGDELIIVNDFSTDDTADILDKLKGKYPGLAIINHLRNKGGAAARNTAVESTRNELLFCLDSDNVLAECSVQALKDYLLLEKADVASFEQQYLFRSAKENPVDIWKLPAGLLDTDAYLNGLNTPGQHGNYLFTKKSWLKAQGYAEGTGALDTWTFGLRQAITGAKMVVLENTHYFHRLDDQKSYWMRDAEARLWSVSLKATAALLPFHELIEEAYLTYMLGDGKYSWFYDRALKPIRLVVKGSKDEFYQKTHQQIAKRIYPRSTVIKKVLGKIKRRLKK